jgi:hypothetical protein
MTRLLNLLVTVLLILPAMSLAAQTLEIKLVDGRNGRPMVGTSRVATFSQRAMITRLVSQL